MAQAASRVERLFIPDGADAVPQVVQALAADRVNLGGATARHRAVGRSRIFSDTLLHGGLVRRARSGGFRTFSARYRARYGQDPVRTATLAYDAVALVAALVKTQGAQRFSEAC